MRSVFDGNLTYFIEKDGKFRIGYKSLNND